MWEDSGLVPGEQETKYEQDFQKMLVNSMESVIKIFYRGMTVHRISSKNSGLKSLKELELEGHVQSRTLGGTKVKQFHAGQVLEYLKDNLKLK